MSQWCYSGDHNVRGCHNGVTAVIIMYDDVAMVLQWCYSGVAGVVPRCVRGRRCGTCHRCSNTWSKRPNPVRWSVVMVFRGCWNDVGMVLTCC
jgi:hypothetical protein